MGGSEERQSVNSALSRVMTVPSASLGGAIKFTWGLVRTNFSLDMMGPSVKRIAKVKLSGDGEFAFCGHEASQTPRWFFAGCIRLGSLFVATTTSS